MVFRVLLSALTLFGGHVVNRRPDRILQIFGLLAVLGIVYSALPSLVFRNADTVRMNDAFNITALILLGIAVLSATLTWKDAKSAAPPALSLGSRLAGGVVSLFGRSRDDDARFDADLPNASTHGVRAAGTLVPPRVRHRESRWADPL
jgi:hypothetical protein